MLLRIDRIQLAVPDRKTAAEGWTELLGAEPDGEDRSSGLAARRSLLRLGEGCVELLEPDGAGPVASAVAAHGAHLFAAGASVADLAAAEAHLVERGVTPLAEGGQLHLRPEDTGDRGLRMVLSPEAPQPAVGAVDGFYEVTHLVADAPAAVASLAELFDLDAEAFVPISSAHYGYEGTLTLFHPDRLHRLEVITPRDASKTMGRFFSRRGPSLYMAFAETANLDAIEQRARERRAGHTAVPAPAERDERGPHTVFLHPPALGGMLLGLSRRTWAWTWSGHPERAV